MLGNQEISIETGKLAKLAGGAVTVRMGDSVLLVTATATKEAREGQSFFPLSVDFEERMYAAGRIPGSFFRREGRPSESGILLSRLVDRGLRPLFPKGYRNDVQVIITALSHDDQAALDTMATLGASAALIISEIPFQGPIANVRIGMDANGEFIVNPSADAFESSRLDLRVSGSEDAIVMVECASSEIDEEIMIQALELAHRSMQPLLEMQKKMVEEVGKEKQTYKVFEVPEEVGQAVRGFLGDKIDRILQEANMKEARKERMDALKAELDAALMDPETGTLRYNKADVYGIMEDVNKETVRRRILEQGERPDGRRPDELRAISAEVDLLPRTHGTGLFTRGETQILSIATLGTMGDAQTLDDLGQVDEKRYLHHYNFPPFSTGEAYPLRGPKRREIGHGALAENALRPMIPPQDEFPYTIRVVSEALASNGSTSMAAVCGSTLALLDAGVPLKAPVGGIAMGLISDGERHQILTDIQGIEDHLGDMDFKVAGTRNGINALQMDIKIKGLTMDLLRQALAQARAARLKILDVMMEAIPTVRGELSPYAPRIDTIKINPDKIGKLIGPGGKTIRGIQDQTGAKIDIEEDGTVYIASTSGDGARAARAIVEALMEEVVLGRIYTGRVVNTREGLGAFVEIMPGTDGLVHISQLADYHVASVEEVVKVGDEIMVMVTDIDDNGKIRLSRQAVLEGWDLETAREKYKGGRGGRGGGGGGGGDRGGRGGGGDRGGRGGGGGDRGGRR
ncbi:MAG: polyribonucleotide nucleotidyltransferase [Ardenticatenales bacterium]|nr:polyribonucleotide nucleotidyltransferase [Ardenticatenales bacterium]